MKKVFFIPVLFLIFHTSFGQGWEWRMPVSSSENSGMISDDLNQIYYYSSNSSNTSFKLDKFYTDGSLIWSKTIIGESTVKAVRLDPNNNVVILGNLSSQCIVDNDTLRPNGIKSFFILKLSPNGIILNINVFGSSDITFANSIFINPSGDYLIGGASTLSFDVNGYMINGDSLETYFLLKTDASFNVLWAHKGIMNTGNSAIDDIVETSSGNYFVVFRFQYGMTDFNGYSSFTSSGLHLLYLDSSRNVLAADNYGYPGLGFFYPYDLRTNGENAYMRNVWTHHSYYGAINRWDVLATHADISWQGGSIGYDIYNDNIFTGIVSTDNPNNPSARWMTFSRLSDSLTLLADWTDSIPLTSYCIIRNIEMIDMSSMYITGSGDGFVDFLGKYDLSLTSVKERVDKPDFELYPNPATEELNIRNIGVEEIRIYNLLGVLIWQKNVENNNVINVSELPPSVYIIEISGSRKVFVKQ
jgi:hypothetical protein